MGRLFDQIRDAVANERYIIGIHAADQMDDRGVLDWQVVSALPDGLLLVERLDAKPNPAVEVEELLPDGTSVKAVWSWLANQRAAKLVTVHYFDR